MDYVNFMLILVRQRSLQSFEYFLWIIAVLLTVYS